jgi:hypothetical protein
LTPDHRKNHQYPTLQLRIDPREWLKTLNQSLIFKVENDIATEALYRLDGKTVIWLKDLIMYNGSLYYSFADKLP